jgi:hypothetical protein
LRGIGGAVGTGGGGAGAGCTPLIGAVAQPASSAADTIAIASARMLTRDEIAIVDKRMAAMMGPIRPGWTE